MNKLILILSLVIFTACSSNDDNNSGNANYFTPPGWIQGTWKEDSSGAILIFKPGDIKYVLNGNTTSFTKEITKFSHHYPQVISSTSNSYVVDFTQGLEGSIIRFNLINESGTKMKSKGYLPGNYTKQ